MLTNLAVLLAGALAAVPVRLAVMLVEEAKRVRLVLAGTTAAERRVLSHALAATCLVSGPMKWWLRRQ